MEDPCTWSDPSISVFCDLGTGKPIDVIEVRGSGLMALSDGRSFYINEKGDVFEVLK